MSDNDSKSNNNNYVVQYKFKFDEETREYAKTVLNETDELRNSSLIAIKQWLDENKHKFNGHKDELLLLAFLRCCKYNLEKTKTKLTNFYNMRRDNPEFFSNRDPRLPKLRELIDMGCFIPLKMHYKNRLVVIIRTAVHDPKQYGIEDVFKVGKMILDVAARENEKAAQIYGVSAIMDMEGAGFWHAKQLHPSIVKKAVFAWENYHCRPQQIEFINCPIYIAIVLNIFKSFMSEKLKKRVQVHYGKSDTIYNAIDKDILPVDYGGNGESIDALIKYWSQIGRAHV